MKNNNKTQNIPAKKAESTNTVNDTTLTAKQRLAARRKIRLLKAGMTEEEINKLINQEKARIITCLLYGTYTVDLGTRKIKRDKKEVEVPNILREQRAVQYTLSENKVTILRAHNNYVIIKSNVDTVDKDLEILAPMGRAQVTKLEAKQESPKKVKKPTNNTKEVRAAAKKRRKALNIKRHESRKYYKLRKQEDVKTFGATQRFIRRGKHGFSRSKENLTLADIKAQNRGKKVGKALIKAEEIKATQSKKAVNNAKKKAAAVTKAKNKKEQELKMAA